MSYLLNHTSVDELDSTIRCAIGNGRPFEILRLQESLDDDTWRRLMRGEA